MFEISILHPHATPISAFLKRLIGGDIYYNDDGHLPQANGRIWYEADINYTSGYRGTDRIFYSNDGLIFVSYDHGATFYEIQIKE